LLRASRLYRTPAWGRTEQPDFINAVALVETGLPARELLDGLLAIERAFGRVRLDGERWGPRTLDLDLLLFGDAVIDEPGLRVPHPHLHERAFALLPLAEIAPQLAIPGIGNVAAVAAGMAADGIEALP
jgi:2-amino-4-hydroxy-6-hydroxymethyldihydropteridine diphosphokinase